MISFASPSCTTALSLQKGLHNSIKLWAMPCKATQDRRRDIAESSDKIWSTRGGNGKPLQYTCRENLMDYIKRQNNMKSKDESPRFEDVQYTTGEEWRTMTSHRKKWLGKSRNNRVVDVSGDESKFDAAKNSIA